MKFFSQLTYTLRGLLSRKGRSFLTILGIIIGVSGVIIIISLGAGAQALVLGQITKLGTNIIGVLPGKSNESGPPASVFGIQIKTFTMQDIEAMRDKSRAPNITAVAPFVRGNATITSGGQNVDTTYSATDGNYPLVENVEMQSGRFFTQEESAGAQVIVLGYDVANQLFPSANGETSGPTDSTNEAIGKIVKIKQVPFRVIGVQAKRGTVAFQNQDDQVFIPFIIGQRQIAGISYVQYARAKIDDAAYVKSSINDVETILREQHKITNPENDDFSVRDLADAIKILTSITDALRMFLALMAGISLLVGGIGIMNIMLVTVTERTREIGLRKALGATGKNIRDQFLIESILLTVSGGILGVVGGSLISFLIALGATYAGYDWKFSISALAILLAVGVSVAIGVTFGLYPAQKASKLDPIEALRYE